MSCSEFKHVNEKFKTIVIKAEVATAEDIEKLTVAEKPLDFPDEEDLTKINKTFNGLHATMSIPGKVLQEALSVKSKLILALKMHIKGC